MTGLVYQAAKRLREAHRALVALEAGRSQKEVEGTLGMHPYAAKMLIRSLRDSAPEDARAGTTAIADLEWWTRGGSDYPEDVAVTLLRFTNVLGPDVDTAFTRMLGLPAADPGGASLLAGAVVGVKGALLDGLVDPGDELPVLLAHGRGIAALHRLLEALEMGPDGACEAPVLEPLAFGAVVPLTL